MDTSAMYDFLGMPSSRISENTNFRFLTFSVSDFGSILIVNKTSNHFQSG